jgi:hypothetical protein
VEGAKPGKIINQAWQSQAACGGVMAPGGVMACEPAASAALASKASGGVNREEP